MHLIGSTTPLMAIRIGIKLENVSIWNATGGAQIGARVARRDQKKGGKVRDESGNNLGSLDEVKSKH